MFVVTAGSGTEAAQGPTRLRGTRHRLGRGWGGAGRGEDVHDVLVLGVGDATAVEEHLGQGERLLRQCFAVGPRWFVRGRRERAGQCAVAGEPASGQRGGRQR